jgi:hypothetical protein
MGGGERSKEEDRKNDDRTFCVLLKKWGRRGEGCRREAKRREPTCFTCFLGLELNTNSRGKEGKNTMMTCVVYVFYNNLGG